MFVNFASLTQFSPSRSIVSDCHVNYSFYCLQCFDADRKGIWLIRTSASKPLEIMVIISRWDIARSTLWVQIVVAFPTRMLRVRITDHCAFSYTAAQIWNAVPQNICISPSVSSFKRNLKPYYFSAAF